MKYKTLCLVLSALLILINTAGCFRKTVPAPIGEAQTPMQPANDPALPPGYVIIDRQSGDVSGDGKPKDIFLIGKKPDVSSKFADDLSIIVQAAGTSPNPVTLKLPNVGGYESKMFIGDFSGDKVNDVFVTIPTGGSGGIIEHRIVTFVGEPKIIWGTEENKGVVATGRFINGFKAELTEEATKRKTTVDLTNKKDTYIKANLYDASGTPLRQQTVSVNPLGELSPLDIDHNGTYGLRGQQRVTGIANADTVANIYSIWKYENQKWTAKQIEVSSILLGYGEK